VIYILYYNTIANNARIIVAINVHFFRVLYCSLVSPHPRYSDVNNKHVAILRYRCVPSDFDLCRERFLIFFTSLLRFTDPKISLLSVCVCACVCIMFNLGICIFNDFFQFSSESILPAPPQEINGSGEIR
jgi:hypothetical protein